MTKITKKPKEVFISHSTKDKPLIDEFVKFIILGLDVDRKNIYCVSYNPDEIPAGEQFTEHIKFNINNSKVVFFLITPNFLESKFCLAELGAAWALGKKIIPIIVEPLNFDALGETPLLAKQAFKLGSVETIADELKKIDGYNEFSITLFTEYAKEFKSKVKRKLKQLPEPTFVSTKEHLKIKKEINTLISINKKLRTDLERCQEYNLELEELKDNKKVQELKISKMDEWEQLEQLIDEVNEKISPLSDLLVSILYYEIKGEDFRPNSEVDYGIWNEVEALKNEDRVFIDENDFTVSLNTEYPDLEDAKDVLNQLHDFFFWASTSNGELVKAFKNKYKMPLSLNSNLFNKLLNKKIYTSK